MTQDDIIYFRHRVTTEVNRAQRASSPGAVKARHQLAEAYLEKIAEVSPVKALKL